MSRMKPILHRDFQVNERVEYDFGSISGEYSSGIKGTGRIIGIASKHVIFTYIVLLDKPLELPDFEGWEALIVPGGQLKPIDDREAQDARILRVLKLSEDYVRSSPQNESRAKTAFDMALASLSPDERKRLAEMGPEDRKKLRGT
jgi:hypothetical protein